jgi:L-aspartate aminotransferase apoenzyme (EC 2.6.1.1)/phosphoserine aminotransferase apoenzyme (EC 2.6.1.52)
MKKKILLTPGPTPVPTQVLLAMAGPSIHHRTPEFMAIFKEMNDNLKYVFQTKNDVFTFAASGTGAMEAAVVNLLSPGDTALCIQAGKFGERWTELCKAYQVNPIVIDVAWGDAVQPEAIEKALKEHKNIKAVFTTLCETSTGVVTDIKAIGQVMLKSEAVLVTDAISALGSIDFADRCLGSGCGCGRITERVNDSSRFRVMFGKPEGVETGGKSIVSALLFRSSHGEKRPWIKPIRHLPRR